MNLILRKISNILIIFVQNTKEKYPFIHRKIINLIYFFVLRKLRGYSKLHLKKKITNGIFEVFLNKDRRFVVKINRRDTKSSLRLYKRLRDGIEYENYKKTLIKSVDLEFINHHTPDVIEVYQDGGYKSSFIKGVNIQILKQELIENKNNLSNTELANILCAIEDLHKDISSFYKKNNFLPGDWMLHNLVYDELNKKIVNVDLEGFYNFQGFVPEKINNLYFLELASLIKEAITENDTA